MKIHITLTNDSGEHFEGNAELVRVSNARKSSKSAKSKTNKTIATGELVFSLNSRAFMNKHAKGMSGSRKFTLLLAYLAKGKTGVEIPGKRIAQNWDQMKEILGGAYNTAHATRAKAEGWIDSPKFGHYALSQSWKEVNKNG